MEAKKDIGKAIREKLDSLDRQPGDALWDAISNDLDKKKKGKFPFFWFYVVSCTLICIAVTAFIFSNSNDTENNNGIKTDSLENTTTVKNNVTKDSSALDRQSHKDAIVGNGTTNANEDTTKSSSTSKGAVNSSNTMGSFITIDQKNKTSHNKEPQSKKQLRKSEDQDFTTNNSNNKVNTSNTAKSTNQFSKHTTSTLAGLKKNTNTLRTQAQTDAQTGNTAGSSPQNNNNDTGSGKSIANTNSNIPQAIDRTTSANGNGNSQTTSKTTENNNSSSDKENIASSIDTKTIGKLNTLAANDSTKNAVDSLKTVIADTKEETKKEDENKKDSIPPVPYKKFSVYAYGGPSYFSFPNRTVVTDSTTSDINTKSTARFGVLFGYNLNRKLSIRTGVSMYKVKQTANGIKLNYTMESTGTEIGLIPTPDFTWIDYQQPFGTNNGIIIGQLGDNYQAIINIDRELSYVEVPLEVNYNLFDRRFGMNVFGGGSMLLLNKNEITAYNKKGKMYLGEWNAAAKTSFTGSMGIGLYYKVSPSFQVNAEPAFNYYFNSYKDSKPYSFTFRIGLQYNFDF